MSAYKSESFGQWLNFDLSDIKIMLV